MAKQFISNSKESSRMFRSDLLEALSKVHFSVPVIIYVPVVVWFLVLAFRAGHPGAVIGCFLGGIAVWSLAEYLLHRFVFHYQPPGKIGARLHFVFHGVHHDYPNDAKRLVMPPSVSIPLAFLFYFLFSLVAEGAVRYALFAGFVLGYLIYDIGHYAIHHFNFKSGWWKRVKRHHMLHHYSDPGKGYGVSSPFWDHIFSTRTDTNKD